MPYKNPTVIDLTIANGGTTSAAFQIRERMNIGIITPAVLTSTEFTFIVSDREDGTYVPLYTSNNAVVSVAVVTNEARAYGLSAEEADALAPFGYAKLVMGSAEGAARALKVVMK